MNKFINPKLVRNCFAPLELNRQLSSHVLQKPEHMCERICQKEMVWLKREKELVKSLNTYEKEVCDLKVQVSKLLKQRDELQS